MIPRALAAALAALALAGAAAGPASAGPAKPQKPGPIMCVDDICKPSRPVPAIARVGPDAPPRAVVRAADHAWIVRHFYWGGAECRWSRRRP